MAKPLTFSCGISWLGVLAQSSLLTSCDAWISIFKAKKAYKIPLGSSDLLEQHKLQQSSWGELGQGQQQIQPPKVEQYMVNFSSVVLIDSLVLEAYSNVSYLSKYDLYTKQRQNISAASSQIQTLQMPKFILFLFCNKTNLPG